ncbi:hypothetical protein [Nostoc sp.]|uniref:hypothetical protein n=1 Tax=Nostoc sp. TaxID=1180 RepID=UPI002FF961BC
MRSLFSSSVFSAPLWFVKKGDRLVKSPLCDRLFYSSLASLASWRFVKKAIAKSPPCDRLFSPSSVSSAPLWFVKKSDRLQNLHRAIASFSFVF